MCPTPALSRASALLLFALAACTGNDTAASLDVSSERDSSGVTIVMNDLDRATAQCTIDAAPLVSIGAEEGSDEETLYRVQGARTLSDGRVAIVNSGTDQVRWYGADGTFERAGGRKGRGPGEFDNAFTVHWRPGDTVYVGDYRPFQFLVFSPEGEWVRSVVAEPTYPNPPRDMHVLADGRLLLASEERGPRENPGTFTARSLHLLLHDANGALVDTITRLDNGRWGQTVDDPNSMFLFPIFESFPVIAGAGDRIILGHASRTELRVHRAEANAPLERIVRWTVGNRAVTAADITAEKASVERRYATLPPEQFARMVEPLITARRPVADTFPAFGQLRIARDGRLWIREFPRPNDTLAHHWIAFTADGRFDCRLDTPRFDRIEEFGADHALVYTRDTLGVERVARYRIGR